MPLEKNQIKEAIELWQNNILMHPMTCVCGEELKAKSRKNKVLLVCPKCKKEQKNLPEAVEKAYLSGYLKKNGYCCNTKCKKPLIKNDSVAVSTPFYGKTIMAILCKECAKLLDSGTTASSMGYKTNVQD